MAPPLFADLGKPARDVFSRGYNFGHLKLDTTTRSGDIEFKTNCFHNIDSKKLFGGIDIKYKIPAQGITLAERWNTDNTLTSEVVIEDKLLKGLKLTLESAYASYVGKRSGKIKSEFKHENVTLNADVLIDSTGGPLLNGAVVAGYQGWFAGAHATCEPSKSKINQSNIGLAYDHGDFLIHANMSNGTDFGGNLYHRVNNQLEIAANLSWKTGEQKTGFGVAAKYDVDRDTVVRAKIANTSQVGLGLTHTLKPGLKLTLSSLLSLQTLNEGGHKFGLGLEYEPRK